MKERIDFSVPKILDCKYGQEKKNKLGEVYLYLGYGCTWGEVVLSVILGLKLGHNFDLINHTINVG